MSSRLSMRLERLLGLRRLRLGLRRLLPVLGRLPLVLDQKALSRHRLTRVTGPGLARPGPPVLFAAPSMLANRQYRRQLGTAAGIVGRLCPADHDMRIG